MKTKIVWFRNDLRLHDNPTLSKAISASDNIIPLYCFDQRQFTTGKYGFVKTGAFRTKFLLECVADLKKNLKKAGGDLVIAIGKPEEIIPILAEKHQVSSVYFSKESTPEEVSIENNLLKELSKRNIDWQSFWTSTLILPEDLSFPLSQTPVQFTKFRKIVEQEFKVEKVLEAPKKLKTPDKVEWGKLPKLEDFGFKRPETDIRNTFPFKGGETFALDRAKEYIWSKELIQHYFDTRNGLLGSDYSSKFSPWLASGGLSPRYIYQEIQSYEWEKVKNKSTYWLVFELLWRDFFHFTAAKHYNRFFSQNGYNGNEKKEWSDDLAIFEKWKEGITGVDFVDANMRELKHTGFMSNRGRQNVASYLINDLKINWLIGAEYFESMLIDHDVCSNYGNWSYLAGVGSDSREKRHFNIEKQAAEYDPTGEYRKLWLN